MEPEGGQHGNSKQWGQPCWCVRGHGGCQESMKGSEVSLGAARDLGCGAQKDFGQGVRFEWGMAGCGGAVLCSGVIVVAGAVTSQQYWGLGSYILHSGMSGTAV